MKPYNGFTPEQRMAAFNWLKGQDRGKLAPRKCDLCGQEHGILEWHSEDYSAPYGRHIGEFGLCYPCHMVLHCRFTAPTAFWRYLRRLEDGEKLRPFVRRDWGRFKAVVLEGGLAIDWQAEKEPWDYNPVTLGRLMAYWRKYGTVPELGVQV